MSKEIVATYEMIRGYKNRPTNEWLAISEFIDNSISSYVGDKENRGKPSRSINGCRINIEFNNEDEDNVKIIISDNARGMSSSELEDAMQPSNRDGNSSNQYNQYGVGMKLGIFWFGENGTIYTKQENNDEYKLEFFTENKSNKEKIFVEAIPNSNRVIKGDHGTTVVISKVYEDRDPILKRDVINRIEKALAWRYKKLLCDGLIIRLIVKSSDEKKNRDIFIKPFEIKPFNYKDFIEEKNNTITKNQREDEYKERLTDLYYKFANGDIDDDLTKEAYEKLYYQQDLIFEKEIIVNNHPVTIKFGIMSSLIRKKNQYSGLTIYHKDRAIVHGPNDVHNSAKQFVQVNIGVSGDTAQFRYLYGELDLTGIEEPDENKSKFLWSLNGENDLESELEKIFYSLKPILDIITKVVDIKSNSIPKNEKEVKQIQDQAKTKLSVFNHFIPTQNENNEMELTGYCILHNEEYKVSICETNSNEVNFIQVDHDGYNRSLTIRIEAEHKFWKPLIGEKNFKGEFLYPIALLLGVTEYFYNNPDVINAVDPKNEKSYIDIIQTLVREWSV